MKSDVACLVLHDACTLWREGNLSKLLVNFEDELVFNVHARRSAPSLVGQGLSKALFSQRLEALLDEFNVMDFEMEGAWRTGFWHFLRVRYVYQHHVSRLIIDGSMRFRLGFVGDKIAHFELFHDSDRMRAFLDMASSRER